MASETAISAQDAGDWLISIDFQAYSWLNARTSPNPMKNMKRIVGISIALLAGIILPASAYTVNWGGIVMGNYLQSDGATPWNSSDFHFEIGTFDPGFDMANEPLDAWSSAWNVLDTSTFSDTFMYFDSSVVIDAVGVSDGFHADTSFDFRGSKLYLWVYNQRETPLDTAKIFEWAVLSGDNWKVPTVTNDPFVFPGEFRTDNATVAYIGAVDPAANGNVIKGTQGYYVSPSGGFDVQTFSVFEAVPEPSTGLLMLFGGLGLLRRKRNAA